MGNVIQKAKYRAKLRFIGDKNREQLYRFFLVPTSPKEAPYILEIFEEKDLDMNST